MKFKDVLLRNFKKNFRNYASYFLCSSFAVMMFFIYSTLIFNKQITDFTDSDGLTVVFTISLIAIVLFSVIFINYAHTSFIKSRYKEFGLYMTLGMTKTEVRKMIIIENSLIMLFSTSTGILSGLIFSRLFQMVTARIVNISDVRYFLDYKSFALTLAVFAIIFMLVIALGLFSTRRLEISELMKESRRVADEKKHSLALGIFGAGALILSLFGFFLIANHKEMKSNLFLIFLLTTMSFWSEYLVISHLGAVVLRVIRKRTNFYLKNILTITEINYKFRQGRKVLFILTVLSAMIVFCMASPFSLYSLADYITEMGQIGHIEYVEISGINNIAPEKLHKIVNGGMTPVESEKAIQFLQLSFQSSGKVDLLQTKPVISASSYNHFFKTNIHLSDGEAINIITDWIPGYHGIRPKDRISLQSGSQSFRFNIKDSVHTDQLKWITGAKTYPASSGIVISDKDFETIKSTLDPKNIGIFHSICFHDWKESGDTVKSLKSALSQSNSLNKEIDKAKIKLFKANTMIDNYRELRKAYSLFIFVMGFIGILFIVSSGSVLYFKQYTEINDTRIKFFKLFKIGITEKEVKKAFSRELLPTFFAPPILGSIIGYAFMYLVTHMVGGEEIMKEFMINATIVVVVYFVFQSIFFAITRHKFIKEIL